MHIHKCQLLNLKKHDLVSTGWPSLTSENLTLTITWSFMYQCRSCQWLFSFPRVTSLVPFTAWILPQSVTDNNQKKMNWPRKQFTITFYKENPVFLCGLKEGPQHNWKLNTTILDLLVYLASINSSGSPSLLLHSLDNLAHNQNLHWFKRLEEWPDG